MEKTTKKSAVVKKVGAGIGAGKFNQNVGKSFGMKVPGKTGKKGWISNECTDGSTSDPIDITGKMKKKVF